MIGVDLVKDRAALEAAYNDAAIADTPKPADLAPKVGDTRTEDGKIELIRNTDIFRPFLLGADAGYLISDTNA